MKKGRFCGEPAARISGVQSRGSDGPAAGAEAALARSRGFASGEIQPWEFIEPSGDARAGGRDRTSGKTGNDPL